MNNNIEHILEALENSQALPIDDLRKVDEKYPARVSAYYLGLIDKSSPLEDPIWRQSMPDMRELEDGGASDEDPLTEEKQMPVPRLIHRYRDRAVLLTTNRCATHCRFCMRKRKWKQGMESADISDKELEDILTCLRQRPGIKEILVSGGDPLMLSNDKIKQILDSLSSLPSIDILRVGSRIPVVQPKRIDNKLATLLGSYPGLWFATHFNHPNEVTTESMKACELLTKAGIPVLNQTVLLKGVNDNAIILEKLFRALIKNKIKPHYLYHIDPVRGVKHFATGIEKGIEILRYFRKNLSSLAVPTFAIDLPEGGGKVPLQAKYGDGLCFESFDGTTIEYPN